MKKIGLLMLALTGCSYYGAAPAPQKCVECEAICAPFPVATCEPVYLNESGRIVYVVCKCLGELAGKGGK